MTTVSIQDAQAKLSELVAGLAPEDELAITRGDRVVARIVGEDAGRREPIAPPDQPPREPGSEKDKIFWMSPDFDEPPEEFRGSME